MSPTATRKSAEDEKVIADRATAEHDHKHATPAKDEGEKGVLGDAVVQPAGPVVETVEDRQGVPRIVNTYNDGWEPAPVSASPEEIQAAKDLAERRDQETKDGLAKLDATRKNHAENKASDQDES